MNRKVSVAPMMDCTDRHERFFLRLISKNTLLYSEMIVSEAIHRGDKKKLLEFNINVFLSALNSDKVCHTPEQVSIVLLCSPASISMTSIVNSVSNCLKRIGKQCSEVLLSTIIKMFENE